MTKTKPVASIEADTQLFQEKVAEEPKKSHEDERTSA